MPRRKDMWRVGIVAAPVEAIVAQRSWIADVHWLPDMPAFTFLADPFGVHTAEKLTLFVESYDYRTRHGIIERLTFDDKYNLADRRTCLREPWHLSYPVVFEGEGATWMLPEAHRSGGLTLYRATGVHDGWVPEVRIVLDRIPVDATPLWYDDRWWLFYSPADTKSTRISHLHIAVARSLCGPWVPHVGNPVRVDQSSSRPGGLPIVIGDRIMLPVQDCTVTYGGAIRPLWISHLSESGFEAAAGAPLPAPNSAGKWCDGMHTLSACGPLTLIDVKRIDTSARGLLLDLKRVWKRFV